MNKRGQIIATLSVVAITQGIYWLGVFLGKKWGYALGKRDAYLQITEDLNKVHDEVLQEINAITAKHEEENRNKPEGLLN